MRRSSFARWALLMLVGCAGCPPPPPVARPYAPPSAEELLAHLRKQRASLRSLRAEAKVDHAADGERVKLTMDLLVADGGRLRLEAQAPVGGGTVATLVADGTRFALLDTRHNRFLEGPAKACNVARFIRLYLPPDDIVAVLLGSVPLEGEPADVGWDASRGREVLTLRTPDGGSERLFLDGRDRKWDLLEAERRDGKGRLLWRVLDDGWADQEGGVRLPARITVEEPLVKVDAKLKLRDVEPNVAVKDEQFRLSAPAGIPPEHADCE